MYDISLLPERYRHELAQEHRKNDFIISFIFTAIIVSILCVLSFSVNAVIKSQLAEIKAENNALQSEIAGLSGYRALSEQVAGIEGNLQSLLKNSPSFPRVLTEITQSVPDSLQLTKITISHSPESMTADCKINGTAAYYDDISAWIDILDQIENIGEIHCSYTNSSSAESLIRIQFELSMDILDASAAEDIVWQPVK